MMKPFRHKLQRLNGKNFSTYRDLRGGFRIGKGHYNLFYIQSDPFAPPSQMEVKIPLEECGLPLETIANQIDRRALCDLIHRKMFALTLQHHSSDNGGRRTGAIGLPSPTPHILDRTAVQIKENAYLSMRFAIVLPDDQRRVDAKSAIDLLLHRLPDIVNAGCWWNPDERREFLLHQHTVRVQQSIRSQLDDLGLVAFIANGSTLPRMAGNSVLPLESAVPWSSPTELECTIEAEGEQLKGSGIPKGISLIVGGGFHGKSTLLHALEQGVYDHIPGDGREGVITTASAVKVQSEEGRWVGGVDLSWFAQNLPGGVQSDRFSTSTASGATSQAAGLVEALEAGSSLLLIDEDASAVNFLLRDARMQHLIAAENEPLIPLIDRLSDLRSRGVSLVMVVGASGEFLDSADRVISMEHYFPIDRTAQARQVAAALPTERQKGQVGRATPLPTRYPQLIRWGKQSQTALVSIRPKAVSTSLLRWGELSFDLSGVAQLVDRTQLQAMGTALHWALFSAVEGESIDHLLARVQEKLEAEGLEGFSKMVNGDLAQFRIQEFAALLCRARHLEMEL